MNIFRPKALALATISLALTSCGGEKKTSSDSDANDDIQLPASIDIASAIGSVSRINVSELGKTLTYLPLETSDTSLLGDDCVFKLTHDKVIVNSKGAGVKAFSLSDGHYLNTIGHYGQDPEAYTYSSFLLDAGNESLLFSGNGSGRWIRYATDGSYLGSFTRVEPLKKRIHPFVLCDTVMVYPIENNITELNPYLSIAFVGESGTMIDSIPIFKRVQSEVEHPRITGNIEMESYNALMRHSTQNIAGFRIGSAPMVYQSSVGLLWRVGAGPIHAMMPFTDTIYEVAAGHQPIPVAVVDFGGKGFPAAKNGIREMSDDEYMLTDLIETDSKIVFGISRGWKKANTGLIGYYDKASNTTRLTHAADGFTDDLTDFMPFYPVTAGPDGSLTGLLTQEDIAKWMEEHPDAKVPEALQAIVDSEEEPNPVLVIVK
ncbi:DUF4934 domain-containing protein [Paramuribaculum intestinale]|uniref:DUF4934 domain-containing protein n=1 Tax=Paramuribaculum intestinale TaxID=2094151 RepID=UPI0025A9A27C|nr:DUF4934 domain-containing protein [Paramuribaculum intestinale]